MAEPIWLIEGLGMLQNPETQDLSLTASLDVVEQAPDVFDQRFCRSRRPWLCRHTACRSDAQCQESAYAK